MREYEPRRSLVVLIHMRVFLVKFSLYVGAVYIVSTETLRIFMVINSVFDVIIPRQQQPQSNFG